MDHTKQLAGKRVLITGAARGIGAALAERLHRRGARVAIVGLEPDRLRAVAEACGDAPWQACDVADRDSLSPAVEHVVDRLGGIDIVVANAGVAGQLPLVGGDPVVMERVVGVNLMGVYNTMWAAGAHISHPAGYFMAVSSLAAAVHLPLMGAYNATKAGVEALANTLRIELRPSGAKVGIAYFAELDTDMTRRGFATEAARAYPAARWVGRKRPLEIGIDGLERGIARRSKRIVAPRWMTGALPARMIIQPFVERVTQPRLAKVLEIARHENAPLTTTQADEVDG